MNLLGECPFLGPPKEKPFRLAPAREALRSSTNRGCISGENPFLTGHRRGCALFKSYALR